LERTWAAQNLYVGTFVLFLLFFFFPLFSSFLLSLFLEHPTLFLDIWIEVVVKGILGALLRNKRG
jgi:hypothetical protein